MSLRLSTHARQACPSQIYIFKSPLLPPCACHPKSSFCIWFPFEWSKISRKSEIWRATVRGFFISLLVIWWSLNFIGISRAAESREDALEEGIGGAWLNHSRRQAHQRLLEPLRRAKSQSTMCWTRKTCSTRKLLNSWFVALSRTPAESCQSTKKRQWRAYTRSAT